MQRTSTQPPQEGQQARGDSEQAIDQPAVANLSGPTLTAKGSLKKQGSPPSTPQILSTIPSTRHLEVQHIGFRGKGSSTSPSFHQTLPGGVPAVAQWDWQHLGSTGTQVQSPAWHSGLGLDYGLDVIPGPGTPYTAG